MTRIFVRNDALTESHVYQMPIDSSGRALFYQTCVKPSSIIDSPQDISKNTHVDSRLFKDES